MINQVFLSQFSYILVGFTEWRSAWLSDAKKKAQKRKNQKGLSPLKSSEFVKEPLQSRFTNIVKVKILLLFTWQTYCELMF